MQPIRHRGSIMEKKKKININSIISTSLLAFTKPSEFFRTLPMLSSKISLLPLFTLTLLNATWIFGITSRSEFILSSQHKSVLNFSLDPVNSLFFSFLVIILIFLALTLVIAIEAAVLQVIIQLMSTLPPSSKLPTRFKYFFILTSHTHVPYLIESISLGIILNGLIIQSNSKIIIDLDAGRNYLDGPVTMTVESIIPILSLVFVITLLISLSLSSYLIYRILFKQNRSIPRMTILKVLVSFNVVKTLLIIIAPIPMLL